MDCRGGSGFCIWYQQLERGTYQIPEAANADEQQGIEISASQLALILDGIDLSSIRRRMRYERATKSETSPQAVPA